ncbi:MAG: hypothetical protein ACK559_42275, partial [bacterium]
MIRSGIDELPKVAPACGASFWFRQSQSIRAAQETDRHILRRHNAPGLRRDAHRAALSAGITSAKVHPYFALMHRKPAPCRAHVPGCQGFCFSIRN